MPILARVDPIHLARVRDAYSFGGGYVAWNNVQFTLTSAELRVVLQGVMYGRAIIFELGIPASQANPVGLAIAPGVFERMLQNSDHANAVVYTGNVTPTSILFAHEP